MHRGDRKHSANGADHALVHGDVALDPLRAHDEDRTTLTSIADPIAGTNAGALRRGVHGNERRVRVGATGDDTAARPCRRGSAASSQDAKKPSASR